MARIPLFQQQQLQSSRVGVPQQNNAGSQMAQSILGATQSQASGALRNYSALATEQNQTAQQNTNFAISQNAQAVQGLQQNLNFLRAEHNRKIDEQKRTEAAQQKLFEDIDVGRLKSEYGRSINKLKNDIQAKYAEDPEKGVKAFGEQSDALIKDLVATSKGSDVAKARAAAGSYGDIEASGKELQDWQAKTRTALHLRGASLESGMLGNTSDIPSGDLNELQKRWNDIAEASSRWDKTVGPAKSGDLRAAAIKESSKNFMREQADKNPDNIDALLSDKRFDKVLDADDRAKLRSQAHTSKTAAEAEKVRTEHKELQRDEITAMGVFARAKADPNSATYHQDITSARGVLAGELDKELSKPKEQQRLGYIKMLDTRLSGLDAAVRREAADARREQTEGRRDATEARRVKNEDQARIDKISRAEYKEYQYDQSALKADAKAQTSESKARGADAYAQGGAARSAIGAHFGQLTAVAKGTIDETQAIVQAKAELYKAYDAGHLKPGEFKAYQAKLESAINRQMDAHGDKASGSNPLLGPTDRRLLEVMQEQIIKPPPSVMLRSLNPHGDPQIQDELRGKYMGHMQAFTEYYTKHHGTPDPAAVRRIRQQVEAKVIRDWYSGRHPDVEDED